MRTGDGSITCLRKPWKLPGPGAAGIDEGGDAAGARQKLGLDAERRAAPVDVGVQVDQAGRDDLACDVAHVLARQIVADGRDLAVREGDVGHLVERPARDRRRVRLSEPDRSSHFLRTSRDASYRILPMAFASAPARGRETLSSPSQSAISRSSSRSGPATCARVVTRLEMRGVDEQLRVGAVGLEIDARHQPVAQQERQHVVAVLALGDRRVDLDAIEEVEDALGAVALPDQRVERRQQGARLDLARLARGGIEIGRLVPALDRRPAADRPPRPARRAAPWCRRRRGESSRAGRIRWRRPAPGPTGAAARAAPPRPTASAAPARAAGSTRSVRS